MSHSIQSFGVHQTLRRPFCPCDYALRSLSGSWPLAVWSELKNRGVWVGFSHVLLLQDTGVFPCHIPTFFRNFDGLDKFGVCHVPLILVEVWPCDMSTSVFATALKQPVPSPGYAHYPVASHAFFSVNFISRARLTVPPLSNNTFASNSMLWPRIGRHLILHVEVTPIVTSAQNVGKHSTLTYWSISACASTPFYVNIKHVF